MMNNIKKYSWLLKPYNIIKQFIYNSDIKYNILLQSPIGIKENKLINFIIKTLLCSNFKNTQNICSICNNCTYFMQYNSHPDLYVLIIDDLTFNINLMDRLIVFSKSLPVFLHYKIIVIVFECEIVGKEIIDFINKVFKNINQEIYNVKILLKLNILYIKSLYCNLFKNCINIKINPPTEHEALYFLKLNTFSNQYKDSQILTSIRLNKNILRKTIFFLKDKWSLYFKFSIFFLNNIKQQNWHVFFLFILNDIYNINLYLYWLETYILDLYKIILNTKTNIICNFYFKNELIHLFKLNNINLNDSILFLKDINKCYYLITKFPMLNKEINIISLYLKWKLLKK